ncbi:protein of unknown function [Methylocaldum szegediense]|uniref:Uncharacterized protein n=1 Tax=Methylocaldum szegediense TaxID=73780 RepID=A0ABM9I0B3_9GAMM|nr:protein of unknown function [Methylocaldum szegediense]
MQVLGRLGGCSGAIKVVGEKSWRVPGLDLAESKNRREGGFREHFKSVRLAPLSSLATSIVRAERLWLD